MKKSKTARSKVKTRPRPQMNTGTRRHEGVESQRKSKYREDYLLDEDLIDDDDLEDGGVLSDYQDDDEPLDGTDASGEEKLKH